MVGLFLACVLLTLVYCQEPGCYRWQGRGTTPYVNLMTADKMCLKLKLRNYILPRIEPGKVGDVVTLDLVPGKKHRRITKAREPPIFEIPDFMSAEECDHIVNVANEKLDVAKMLGKDGQYNEAGSRLGKTTFLRHDLDPVLLDIQQRVVALTGMPIDIIQESEFFQVGYYNVGGYYHSHYDSSTLTELPCCHNTELPHRATKCLICRYITVLVYLNDVEEGGETAFPLADTENVELTEKHINLTRYCHHAPVVVDPEKGKAVMWYNNRRNPQTGWIGDIYRNSLHGGCPVLKGEKWISNIWVSASKYEQRNSKSIYTNRWT